MLDENRKGRITASAVGAILGCAPYATRDDIMRRMVREHFGINTFFSNVATEYGTTNESSAIFDFEIKSGITRKEAGFFIHPEIDYLGATPDGLIGQDAILEVKCPYGLRNQEAPQFKTIGDQPHYYAQVQIQLFCTNRTRAYFYQWAPNGDLLETVDADPAWLEQNLPLLADFYKEFKAALKDPDFWLSDEIDAQAEADAYRAAKAHVELATKQLEAAKEALVKIADGRKCNISGLLVYQVEREGSVSYAKALKDLAPDANLDAYKGKGSSYWVVK